MIGYYGWLFLVSWVGLTIFLGLGLGYAMVRFFESLENDE